MLILFEIADSGRVKVFVRIRPPRPQESSRKELIAVDVQEVSSQVGSKCNQQRTPNSCNPLVVGLVKVRDVIFSPRVLV